MDFTALLVAALAVWRVTHLLHAENGPWDVMARLRRALGRGFLGRLFDCFYCLTLWVAAPAALWVAMDWLDRAMAWLAISGSAILLERVAPPPAAFVEDAPREDSNAVLRKDEDAVRGGGDSAGR